MEGITPGDTLGLEALELEGPTAGEECEDDSETGPPLGAMGEPGGIRGLHLRRLIDDFSPPRGCSRGRPARPGMDEEKRAPMFELVEQRSVRVELGQRCGPHTRPGESLDARTRSKGDDSATRFGRELENPSLVGACELGGLLRSKVVEAEGRGERDDRNVELTAIEKGEPGVESVGAEIDLEAFPTGQMEGRTA